MRAVVRNQCVIDFHAAWCGPCKRISPKYKELATSGRVPGAKFLKVDVDECEEVSSRFDLRSIPAFFFYKNGVKVREFSGGSDEAVGKIEQVLLELAAEP